MVERNKTPISIKKIAQAIVAFVGISSASGAASHPKNIDPDKHYSHIVTKSDGTQGKKYHGHTGGKESFGHFPAGMEPKLEIDDNAPRNEKLWQEAGEEYKNDRLREFFKATEAIYDSWKANVSKLENMQAKIDDGEIGRNSVGIKEIRFARAMKSAKEAVAGYEFKRDSDWEKHQAEIGGDRQENGTIKIYNKLLKENKLENQKLAENIESHQMGKFADGINQSIEKNITNVFAPQDHSLWEVKEANAESKKALLNNLAGAYTSLNKNIQRKSDAIGDDYYEQGLKLGVDRLKLDFYKSVYNTVKNLDANGPQIEKAKEMASGIGRARDTIQLAAAVGYKHIPLTAEFPDGKGGELPKKENIDKHTGGRFYARAKGAIERAINREGLDNVALGGREEGWRTAFKGAVSKEYDRQKTDINEGQLDRAGRALAVTKLDVYKALYDVLGDKDLKLGQMSKAKEIFDNVGVAKKPEERDAALKVDNFYSKMEGRGQARAKEQSFGERGR